jgi:hypothetical protein
MRTIVTSFFLTLVLLLSGSFAWAQYDMRNSSNPYMGMDLRTKMALEERDKRLGEQQSRQKAQTGTSSQKGTIQVNQPIKQQPKQQQAIKQQPKPQPTQQQAIKQQSKQQPQKPQVPKQQAKGTKR